MEPTYQTIEEQDAEKVEAKRQKIIHNLAREFARMEQFYWFDDMVEAFEQFKRERQ